MHDRSLVHYAFVARALPAGEYRGHGPKVVKGPGMIHIQSKMKVIIIRGVNVDGVPRIFQLAARPSEDENRHDAPSSSTPRTPVPLFQ